MSRILTFMFLSSRCLPKGVESTIFRNEDRKMSTDISPTPTSGAMGNPQFLSQGNIPHSLTHIHMHRTESLFPHKVRGI